MALHKMKVLIERSFFARVVRITSLRALLALAALHDFYIHQMDVTTTFLNGTLEEINSLEPLEGYIQPGDEDKVGLVLTSLCGLKQGP